MSAKGACANYGQLCSLNALPYCSLLLHQPDIPTLLQYTLRWSADTPLCVVLTPLSPTRSVSCTLWPWRFTKQKFWRPRIFCLPRLVSGWNSVKDLVWKRWKLWKAPCWAVTHGYKSTYAIINKSKVKERTKQLKARSFDRKDFQLMTSSCLYNSN